VPLALGEDGADLGGELARALAELKAGLEQVSGRNTQGASVHMALLPPLSDARMVSLPAMRKSEVEAVLGRDVARYFLGANRPRVVGVRLPRENGKASKGTDGKASSVLAAAAPIGLMEALRSALESVGWWASSFSSSHGAWLDAASTPKSPPKAVVAVLGATAHIVRLDGSDPVAVRQVPLADQDAVVEAVGRGSGSVMVLAEPRVYEELSSDLARSGSRSIPDPEGWSGAVDGTAGRAAASALEFVPPAMALERKEKGRKTVSYLAGAAVVLVVASLGAQLWGAHRQLGAVREQRASIRSEVVPLLQARDSLNGLTTQVQSLAELSRSTPVWTRSLVELTALLPPDIYLTGFFASGDTVELEAAGSHAGRAIQVLREAGLFEEIRLQGLVERQLNEGETVEERFKLWARLPGPGGEGEES
jgi:hypothetical protein